MAAEMPVRKNDRRKSVRVPVVIPCFRLSEMDSGSSDQDTFIMANLSLGGAFVLCRKQMEVGSRISFYVPDVTGARLWSV